MQIKHLKSGFKPKTELIRDFNGEIMGNKQDIMNIWKKYFEQVLNPNINLNADVHHTSAEANEIMEEDSESIEPPSLEEVKESLERMKPGKAPGEDGLTAEILRAGGEQVISKLHSLIKDIWINERIPKDWRKSIICPIHKKGDKLTCANYRGICLLSTSYKIFTGIIKKKLEIYSEKTIGIRLDSDQEDPQ